MGSGLNVVHIAAPGPFGLGGLESVLVGLGIGLHHRGVNVTVAAVMDSKPGSHHGTPDRHPVVASLTEAGVSVCPIRIPRRGYLQERREVRRLLEASRPDVVHTHDYRPDLLDSGIAREMGIPTVTTIHGSSRMSWRTALYEWLDLRLARRFQAVVAVSRPMVADLRRAGVPSNRVHLVPNAWDGPARPLSRAAARKALGLPCDAFVVGWVGRLIPVKGCDIFLRALSRLADTAVQASVIGGGPEQGRLEALAARLGISQRVHFHGPREGAANLFRAFDLWVLSSRSEGTPMVLFEAMAAGVPIVATAVGGVGDVVSEAEACLVPPEDPDALAACLEDVRSGKVPTRKRVAAAGARLAERFGTEQWIDRHLEIYRALAQRRERR